MTHVKLLNNKCIVNLNSKFYPVDVITKSVDEFKDKRDINIDKEGQIVIKSKDKNSLEKQAYEFCDYLLGKIQEGSY